MPTHNAGPSHPGVAPRTRWTLRAQLLAGLGLILPVVALSAGLISRWSVRQEIADRQIHQMKMLGKSLATLVAPLVEDEAKRRARLHELLSGFSSSPYMRQVEIVDERLQRLAGVGLPVPSQASEAQERAQYLRRAVRTERQIVRVGTTADERVDIITPVYRGGTGRAIGAVSLSAPLGPGEMRPMAMFWVLMAVDGLVLLLFVWVVLTRYFVRPVEALQRAASRLADGDLDVHMVEQGAFELTSLARSFNGMTVALRDQLQRLEAQRQTLIQSEKLASVGRLAAGIAHEVGNPLQSIIGFTDMLAEGDLEPATRQDYLQRIEQESQRIHGILKELLDYSRPVEERPEAASLAQALKQALGLLQHHKRFAGVRVRTQGVDDAPPVRATQTRIVQVLMNLLLNAADAMGEGGAVDVVATSDEHAASLRLSNTGPAIPKADRERIFDPFFSTKDPGRGTGLGLAVARSIIDSFGGQLTLADEPVTTFEITLPLSEG